MSTVKIKYVGLKNEEAAFSRETGITWTPGLIESVDLRHATAMLNHPDVFELAEEPVSLSTAIPVLKAEASTDTPETQTLITLPDGTDKALDDLDKEQLHALAKEMGVAVHPNSGAAKVAEALTAAFGKK